KLADARQYCELADVLRGRVVRPGDHAVKAFEQRFGLGDGLPLDRFGHQRGRGLRDRAPRALERGIADDPVLDLQIDRDAIATERIVAFGLPPALERPEVPRPLVVIEDHLLVQVLKVSAHAKPSRTLCSAAASAASSSRVLYRARDARDVAGTPRRAM